MLSRRAVLAALAGVPLAPLAGLAASRADLTRGAGTATIDHGAWTSMLATYVRPDDTGLNRVAYRRWKAEAREPLAAYVAMLQSVDPATLTRAEQFAYWANLYNAETIAVVLEHYPVASIRDIDLGGSFFGSGPWSRKLVSVRGVDLSLDDIEHRILRPVFRDARVHYAVNCASIGCPNLQRAAFSGAGLDGALDRGARDYINHPRGVSVAGGAITASRIYDWFAEDFGDEAALRDHWLRYADPARRGAIAGATGIAGYDYDWGLNDAV